MRQKTFFSKMLLLLGFIIIVSCMFVISKKRIKSGILYTFSSITSIQKSNNESQNKTSIYAGILNKTGIYNGLFNTTVLVSKTKDVKIEESRYSLPVGNGTCPFYSGIPYDAKLMKQPLPLEIVKTIEKGGFWRPHNCNSSLLQRVAVIISYRNRNGHLKALLASLHRLMQAQNQNYRIFVANQVENTKFNRAMLFNVAVRESLKMFKADCLIFHDTDMLPERITNRYDCHVSPRHLAYRQNRFNFKGKSYATGEQMWRVSAHNGGVMAVSLKQFIRTNGFSNFYFGWGLEDDDFAARLVNVGYKISKEQNGYYTVIPHPRDKGNEAAYQHKEFVERHRLVWQQCEGYNSLQKDSCYQLKEVKLQGLYTELCILIPKLASCN